MLQQMKVVGSSSIGAVLRLTLMFWPKKLRNQRTQEDNAIEARTSPNRARENANTVAENTTRGNVKIAQRSGDFETNAQGKNHFAKKCLLSRFTAKPLSRGRAVNELNDGYAEEVFNLVPAAPKSNQLTAGDILVFKF